MASSDHHRAKRNYILDTSRKVTYATRHRFSLCSQTSRSARSNKPFKRRFFVNFCHFVRRCVAPLLLVSVMSLPGFGQMPHLPGKKDKPDQPRVSETPTVLSDADKAKMAEIADRPEVKQEIEQAWQAKRRADLDYAYNVNSSIHFADITGPQFAEFREKYG